MFLLDTNHCSSAILGNTQLLDRLTNLGDELITTCTIVKGELIDMAARSQQLKERTVGTCHGDMPDTYFLTFRVTFTPSLVCSRTNRGVGLAF